MKVKKQRLTIIIMLTSDWNGHHLRHLGEKKKKKKVQTSITKDQQYAVMSVSGVFFHREMTFPY